MGLFGLFKCKSNQCLNHLAASETSSDDQTDTISSFSSLNEDLSTNCRLAVFSLSTSSSSSSIDELFETSPVMSTRILPVGLYRDSDSSAPSSSSSSNNNEKSSSMLKRLTAYRPYENEGSTGSTNTSSSSSSSSSSLASKKEIPIHHHRTSIGAGAAAPPLPLPSRTTNHLDQLTIEQNLFNMVRFDVVKSNFCDFYQLGAFVRSGGFSDIYEGIRLSDNKDVVVKFIPKEKTKNWLMISQKKYPAEVLLHKAVHEIQGIIHVYDYFENAQKWILVMERLRNCQDLFDFLEGSDRGRLTENTARKFFQQLVQINLAMLKKGVVHRDLKSENILVDLETESLVLIDFGASAIYKASTSFYSDFHGTKQYKSPEYILKKRYAAVPSTVWTMGVLLYDMVCGCLPFENEEDITGSRLVLKPYLSTELKNLIQRCLSPNPDRRPSLESLLEHPWVKG